MTSATTVASHPVTVEKKFMDQVMVNTPGETHLEMCIQCGSCGGSCPSAAEMDHTPRSLIALIRAGNFEEVLSSNTPWYCVSCYYCTVRCPQEIHITDVMYTLKRMAVHAGIKDPCSAPDFSKTFVSWVENYGRAFELGLMSMFRLRHDPLGVLRITDMALGMVSKGRMDLAPKSIKGLKSLKAIIARAKALEVVA